MINRVFIVDSNLIKTSGHPVQFCLALEQTCTQLGLEVYVLANRRIQSQTSTLFRNLQAQMTYTSFEIYQDGSVRFTEDLCQAHAEYHFGHTDLILATSAYINEITGAVHLEQCFPYNDMPAIALNFHQLFPPTTPSSLATTSNYQKLWMQKLGEAFSTIQYPASRISLWTTNVRGLNQTYRLLSGHKVGKLPLISPTFDSPMPRIEFSDRKLVVAFLGDGRSEKGLLLFLMAILELRDVNISFLLQNIDERGYGMDEQQKFQKLLADVQGSPAVKIVNTSLTPIEYHELLHQVDVVVLPYDPSHYKDRASGVFVEAVQAKKVVVIPDRTWMADELRHGRASGVVFQYIGYSIEQTAINLQQAILNLKQTFHVYQQAAQQKAIYYQDCYTSEQYLKKILKYYHKEGTK